MTETALGLNRASDLDNIVILPEGRGFRTRGATTWGNSTEFNSANDYPVVGVGILNLGGSELVLAVRNGKLYSSTATASRGSLSFTERTGALTINTESTAASEITSVRWSFCNFNSLLIGFGGDFNGTPDAPFKWTGSGNASALGGTPPSAMFCFAANNRVFAARTSAAKSTLYWSILGNPEDWTGTGSGSAVIGNLDDNEPITGCVVLSSNRALIFKQTGIYQVDLTQAPFSSTILFSGVGCGTPGALVGIDGEIFFLDVNKKMYSTDGNSLQSYPDTQREFAGQGGGSSFSTYYHGFRLKSAEDSNAPSLTTLDWLVWSYAATTAITKNLIWDLRNKCWLRCTTGMKFTSSATTTSGIVLGGWYNQGRLFIPNDLSSTTDDTGESSGDINCYWQSGQLNPGDIDQIVQVNRFIYHGAAQSAATATLTYGFSFKSSLNGSATISLTGDGDASDVVRRSVLAGRGNAFKFKLALSTSAAGARLVVRSLTLGGKVYGQKIRTAG